MIMNCFASPHWKCNCVVFFPSLCLSSGDESLWPAYVSGRNEELISNQCAFCNSDQAEVVDPFTRSLFSKTQQSSHVSSNRMPRPVQWQWSSTVDSGESCVFTISQRDAEIFVKMPKKNAEKPVPFPPTFSGIFQSALLPIITSCRLCDASVMMETNNKPRLQLSPFNMIICYDLRYFWRCDREESQLRKYPLEKNFGENIFHPERIVNSKW